MPTALCKRAISEAETVGHIPDLFLSAIGRVESGRSLGANGQLVPWPWTVDAGGEGHFYPTKEAAIAATREFQAHGIRSIDVGCLQVNLLQHPDAFPSLEQAFDPRTNARFAAQLLSSLFQQTGSWPLAAAAYHSQTPSLGAPYQQRVLAAWATPETGAAGKRAPGKADPAAPHVAEAAAPGGVSNAHPLLGFTRDLRLTAAGQSPALSRGRDLDAYRHTPVMLAWRTTQR